MKHEKFKLISVQVGQYGEVEAFLNSGNISPKSLSITRVADQSVVSIGYEEAEAFHAHQLVTHNVPGSIKLEDVANDIEAYAAGLDGVICQDIVYNPGTESFIVTFLTTK